ncbi:hypothetical protein I6J71_15990 [Amycolatopsis sp. FDAARGOS 1241]|nr:hypothetical protein I6J71_15990 [Amycolatopsis sp. FDAARGOS 1241]
MGRIAGAVLAGAALTIASAPAAFAQDDPSAPAETTVTSETTTDPATPTTSETSPSDPPTTDSGTPAPGAPPSESSSAPAGTSPRDPQVQTTDAQHAPAARNGLAQNESDAGTSDEDQQDADETSGSAEPGDGYTDNVGHGFVGLGGEGVLVIACAQGAPGNLATLGLTVTAGPDQDGADGRYWNYDVRVTDGYTGTTAPFSWTCGTEEGHGDVTFEQEQPPTSDAPTPSDTPTGTSSPEDTGSPVSPDSPATSATAPGSTASTTSGSARSTTRPTVQVRYAPQGGVETGFGGTARFWS